MTWILRLCFTDGSHKDYREPSCYDCYDRWQRIQEIRSYQATPKPLESVAIHSPDGQETLLTW